MNIPNTHTPKKSFYVLLMVFISIAILALVTLSLNQLASFANITDLSKTSYITIDGRAEIEVEPTEATFVVTASEHASTAAQAQELVSQKISPLLISLQEVGVTSDDIETESYTTNPRYDWQTIEDCTSEGVCVSSNEQVKNGFDVSQRLTISVDNIDKNPNVSLLLNSAGLHSINGPNFTLQDGTQALNQARNKAIENANQTAASIGEKLGFKVIKPIDYVDLWSSIESDAPLFRNFDTMMISEGSQLAPELPTQKQTASAEVGITYKIKYERKQK